MLPLLNGSFACITADPPWSFKRYPSGGDRLAVKACVAKGVTFELALRSYGVDGKVLGVERRRRWSRTRSL